MRKFNYITALCVVFLLAAVSVGWAFGEIRYADRPLNLRKGRSARTAWVGSLYAGQKVRVAYVKDGWAAVFEPGGTNSRESAAVGYSNVKYLKTKRGRHEPKGWGELVYTPRTLNVRSKPSTKGRKLDSLKGGEHVRIDFPEDDWAMVFWPSSTIRSKLNARGFSSAKYFQPATKQSLKKTQVVQQKAPAPAPVSKPVSAGSGDGQVAGSVAPPPPAAAPKAAPVVAAKPVPVKAAAPKAAPKPVAKVVPKSKPKSAPKSSFGTKKTMVIDRSKFAKTKRPDPTPDKIAHGYQYRIIEKSETKRLGETWITVKVFLASKKLPGSEALRDFSTSIWREYKRANKNVAVLVYMPGMDLEDLAYGVTKFDDSRLLEFWVRKATLFGTEFL